MRVLTAQQIRDWDAYTIQNEPISSVDLMERAAQVFTERFVSEFNTNHPVMIICGIGNNGGDGLVIARLLYQRGYDVYLQILEFSKKYSDDFSINLERLKTVRFEPKLRAPEDGLEQPSAETILVDAIFGSGLNRPVQGALKNCIEQINAWPNQVISVDIPSGLMADSNKGNDADAIIRANQTWTFQCPKQSFLIPEWGVFPGEWEVLDIGLHSEFPELKKARWSMITEKEVRSRLKPRGKFSHKGTFGHATIVAGSYGMMGSAAMAVKTALRSGCGLVTAHVPKCGVDIIQTLAPEAMVQANSGELYLRPDTAELRGSWGLGPGIGQDEETAKALKQWLEKASSVVIDADALNLISQDSDLAGLIPKGSILTPHPKELIRLTGKVGNRLEQIEHACQLAARIDGVVVLKGAFTAICTADGKVWFNATGNTALSKGGSGDVLTGLLTGLLAQGYSSEEAAMIGVHIHGRAAEALVRAKPAEACTAIDLIHCLWL